MRNDLPKTCKEPKRYSVSVQYEQRLYCTETAISEVFSVKNEQTLADGFAIGVFTK